MNTRFPPQRILVAMDLSDASLNAWKQAQLLSRRFGSKLEAVYVQEWFHSALGLGTGEPFVTAEAAERALEALQARLGPEVELRALTGAPDEVLTGYARRSGFELIVIGTHARKGLDRVIRGSIAESVVHRSPVPVLVAKTAAGAVRSVLVPYKPTWYAWQALEAGARAAAALGARLSVLYVLTAPLFRDQAGLAGARRMVEDLVARLPAELRRKLRPEIKLGFGDPAREIVSEAAGHGLIVLSARSKGFLADQVLGTTAERVLRHAPCSVLAIPLGAPPKKKPSER